MVHLPRVHEHEIVRGLAQQRAVGAQVSLRVSQAALERRGGACGARRGAGLRRRRLFQEAGYDLLHHLLQGVQGVLFVGLCDRVRGEAGLGHQHAVHLVAVSVGPVEHAAQARAQRLRLRARQPLPEVHGVHRHDVHAKL